MLPWLFPAPVRRSRFRASSDQWRRFNVEVAPDRVAPWNFGASVTGDVLWFDYQTQLDSNRRGRHGSGRGGVYGEHYVKGVGRTPAAGNWNDRDDRYHGSGHMSVVSAIRERMISTYLEARGLGETIVPCVSVLAASLSEDERRLVRKGHSSSREDNFPADGRMMALSVKRADFARISNFVWALNHVSTDPADLGGLFVDFERYLRAPGDREKLSGEPKRIVALMDRAFRRGLANFRMFAQHGLFWLYLQNNFTLDGRFVDLETPLVFDEPFLGLLWREDYPDEAPKVLGFEEFSFVWHWRIFVAWLRGRLAFLTSPGVMDIEVSRLFLQAIAAELDTRFAASHLLYAEDRLEKEAVANVARVLDAGTKARAQIVELARFTRIATFHGDEGAVPQLGWRRCEYRGSIPIAGRSRVEVPAFLTPSSSCGERFGEAIRSLGSAQQPVELLRRLGE